MIIMAKKAMMDMVTGQCYMFLMFFSVGETYINGVVLNLFSYYRVSFSKKCVLALGTHVTRSICLQLIIPKYMEDTCLFYQT